MSTLERAIVIAAEGHAGATDKAGAPYILHPLRMMLRLSSPEERIVAVLHDVVEDCPGWTFDRLRNEGFPRRSSRRWMR
jgi:(p)ppGpp synthase/HD superfamily hydrolase